MLFILLITLFWHQLTFSLCPGILAFQIHDLAASLKEKLSKEEVDKLIHEAGHDVKGRISLPELRNLIGK